LMASAFLAAMLLVCRKDTLRLAIQASMPDDVVGPRARTARIAEARTVSEH
jgi:hypothetical protein